MHRAWTRYEERGVRSEEKEPRSTRCPSDLAVHPSNLAPRISNLLHQPIPSVLLWGILAFIDLFMPASAQPVLNLKRIVNNWPTIELYFTVSCNGYPVSFTDERHFAVVENGVDIPEFELWCPEGDPRCSLGAVMVLDASANMAAGGNAAIRSIARTFIDLMDGMLDEMAVLWFNQLPAWRQSMTGSKALLKAAVDGLPAAGKSAVWDALYEAVLELPRHPANPCRGVILMTDGNDNASTHTSEEVIDVANRSSISIYPLGVGGAINSAQLQLIATRTGGRYYENPTAAQIVSVYQEMMTLRILPSFQECVITYTATCMDGTQRVVDMTVKDFCGGNDTKTKLYSAPRDTSVFMPLRFRIGAVTTRSGRQAAVPLELLDPVDAIGRHMFQPAAFDLAFDTSLIRFEGITVPPGSPWEGVPVTVMHTATGVRLATTQRKAVTVSNVPALLAQLLFDVPILEYPDTVCVPIRFDGWTFDGGCFRPVLRGGEICIVPRIPEVVCAIVAPPALHWRTGTLDYDPNPFTVEFSLVNIGDGKARNARARLLVDKADATPVAPMKDQQPCTPSLIGPATLASARWDLLATRRATGDSVRICLEASFDNHPNIDGCVKIWIPAAFTTTAESPADVPGFELDQNMPNPTTGLTEFVMHLPDHGTVTLTVLDILGRRLATAFEGALTPGSHRILFDATRLPPGVYACVLRAAGRIATRWMIRQ